MQQESDEIRLRQLNELNTRYDEGELNAFNQAANALPPLNEGDLRQYESILLKIFASNQQSRIFNQNELERIGVSKFRHWCREALLRKQKWGRYYWQSQIRKIDRCNSREKAGMLWRSLSC